MNRFLSHLVTIVAASTLGVACGFEHATNVVAPTTGSGAGSGTNNGPTSTPSLVGLWTSAAPNAAPTLPDPNTCGHFQYQIASQTSTTISGSLSARCGDMTVSATANGQLNGTSVTITLNGAGSMPGLPTCTFSITSNGTIEDNGNTLRLPFTGTTCLGPVHGTEVLHRPQPSAPPPPPPPAPEPPPAPAPPPPSGPTDAIDLHQATITGGSPADVADWPVAATITGLNFQANGLRLDFTKKDGPGRWPDVVPPGWDGPLQYTVWMVVNIGGRWYTSGGVEFWYGLERSGGPPSLFAGNWYYNSQVWGPLANRQPAIGEQVGFLVTAGDARVKDVRSVRERSNVVVVPFPSDAGATFTFSALRTR
jgi:hypothetical protein